MTDEALSPRGRLYDRLPVTPDADWWCRLAAASPDGRVLELGAGTGRLTQSLADHAAVVAVDHDATMVARLRERVAGTAHPVEAIVADVTTLRLDDRYGLVALPVSLLNEIRTAAGRRATIATAAAHCRDDGRVAFSLINPLWLLTSGPSGGVVEGVDGEQVRVDAGHTTVDLWSQHARARLTYAFADGERLHDELDAAAVFPAELELLLERCGMVVEQAWGAVPGEGPPESDDGAWHVVARFA